MDPKPSSSHMSRRMDPRPSSSDMSRRNYDVFLSFRGPDTRHSIVSHLSRALLRSGVYAFMDSEELEAGDRRAALFQAIEGSRVAVVVFSESYADSKWCLDELTKIIERRNQGWLTVIPIFYKVTPGEVRLHEKENGEKGCYQMAMEVMEAKHGKDWVSAKNWRKSLWEAGDLIGFPLLERDDEGEVVDKVVKKVIKVLSRVPLHVAKYPVGIGRRLVEIKQFLHLDPHVDDVYMVGIHGLGGVGKTTLSKAICNDICHEFDGWCFLPNVREKSKSLDGLVLLQQKLLRDLTSTEIVNLSSVDSGKVLIGERLRYKRVLIILDDVDNLGQFDALAGNRDWFGKGSRIIITTRDNHVLAPDRVQHIYKVGLLDSTDADDLFQRHAFTGQGNREIDRTLIDRFLRYADGLPLALMVLGSFLCGRRDPSLWESTLEMLDKEPEPNINSVLKISFHGLDAKAQEFFLDMACFFKGWDEDYVMKVLRSCGYPAPIKRDILIERCLLTVEDGKFQMHDLLQVMGKSIVLDGDAGLPSRIWKWEDFRHVLSENMENNAVEGIVLDLAGIKDGLIKPSTFKGFRRLRLLIVQNAHNFKGCLHLPGRLRWFAWPGYSGSTLELHSSIELVGLDLHESMVYQLNGMKFKKLKYLNLSNCKFLLRLPDIFMCSELEDMNISGCVSLMWLDEIVGSFDKLVHLNLRGCRNLTRAPSFLLSENFQTLDFSGCFKLDRFPAIKGKLWSLGKLVLDDTSIEVLPDTISDLVAVKYLSLANCKVLRVIPSSIYKLRGLQTLIVKRCSLYGFPRKPWESTSDVDGFPDLVRLELECCYLVEVEFLRDLTCFETLKKLLLSDNHFQCIPDCLSWFRNLEELSLRHCRNLVAVPRLPGVVKLSMEGCQELRTLPSLHTLIGWSSRRFEVDLSRCDNLDPTFITRSLQFEIVREFVGAADVIVPRQIIPSRIPNWTCFHSVPDNPFYRVPLPEGMLEDDILGLMLSVTFRAVDFSVGISLVGNRLLIRRSVSGVYKGLVHVWIVYIPHRSLSHEDENFMVDMDWSDIAFGISGQGTTFESFALQVICKQEQDNKRFVVHNRMVSRDALGIDGVLIEEGSCSDYGSTPWKRNDESILSKMMVDTNVGLVQVEKGLDLLKQVSDGFESQRMRPPPLGDSPTNVRYSTRVESKLVGAKLRKPGGQPKNKQKKMVDKIVQRKSDSDARWRSFAANCEIM